LIQIFRSIIRHFRTAMKKSVGTHCLRGSHPPVVFRSDRSGITIHAQHGGIAISLQVDARSAGQEDDQIIVPAKAIDDFEGREFTPVELQSTQSQRVTARWVDHCVPRVAEYEVPSDANVALPTAPMKFTANDRYLLKALDDAMRVVSLPNTRYATDKVQLQSSGVIASTDAVSICGSQGFAFPGSSTFLCRRSSSSDSASSSAINPLEAFGKVHVIVSNGATTLEAVGQFGGFSTAGVFFNVQTDSLDMHIRRQEIGVIFAVEKPSHLEGKNTFSFQVFDRSGNAAFKVFLNFGGAITADRAEKFNEMRDGFRKG
jgi:hypothetical protein